MKTFVLQCLFPIVLFCGRTEATLAAAPPSYRVAAGWEMAIAAEEPLVVNPVTMTFGDDGRLYVCEWAQGGGPNDRIRVLSDDDGDGKFDRSEIYMDHLELPAGILFWDGWTYITLNHEVVRFRDRDGDGRLETREVVASGFGNDNSHHRVSGMALGPDGFLYLTTGDSDAHAKGSDGSEATVLRCGGVFRCRPDGSGMENVAFGMRNPWGNVAFDDQFQIFHTDNDNEGSPGFTGCRLLQVVERGDYGWRLREGARCCAPDFLRATWNGGRPGRLGWIAETGRGAPAGLCVVNSFQWPASRRNLLVYPDVFRKLVRAYSVTAEGAAYKVDREFELLASDDPLFRPNDAEEGPDGSLYVLDWRTDSGGAGMLAGNGKTGRIYRLSNPGFRPENAPFRLPGNRRAKLSSMSDDELIGLLDSDILAVRTQVSLELVRRGLPEIEKIRATSVDPNRPAAARRHAFWILALNRTGHSRALWSAWLSDPDPANRRLAYEAVSRQTVPGEFVDWVIASITDHPESSAPLRRAQALALGRAGKLVWTDPARESDGEAKARSATDWFLMFLRPGAHSDPFLADAAVRGLEDLGPIGLKAAVTGLAASDEEERRASLFALAAWRSRAGVAAIETAAISDQAMPTSARVYLFNALRELLPDVSPGPIAQWLRRSRGGDSAARVQATEVLLAMGARAFPDTRAVAAELLEDPDQAVRFAGLELAKTYLSPEAERILIVILHNAGAGAGERRAAASALRGYRNPEAGRALAQAYESAGDTPLRIELLAGLADIDFSAAADRAMKLLDNTNADLRREAIRILGQKPATAVAVARAYNSGTLNAQDLPQVIDALRKHASPELRDETAKLLKTGLLSKPGGDDARRIRFEVDRHGDANRGKAIYIDVNKANCASCHRMEGFGGAVGPDLTRVWQTLSFEKRLESILEPSKEIKEGYIAHKIATKDGKVVVGLLVAEDADAVTLKNAEGKEVRIAKPDIEERGPDAASLMPAGVAVNLTFDELADLLRFLGDRQAQESLRSIK